MTKLASISTWFALFGLLTSNACAVDEQRVINEMTRKSGLSAAEIQAHYKDGCASGAYLPMLICNSYDASAANLEMGDQYKKLLTQLTTKAAKSKLEQAQKAWLVLREKTCEYECDGYAGGRDWGFVMESCRARITQERVKKLNEYLTCNQPGCPGEW